MAVEQILVGSAEGIGPSLTGVSCDSSAIFVHLRTCVMCFSDPMTFSSLYMQYSSLYMQYLEGGVLLMLS